ncbi:11980_t:CDS:2, partial [Gigaspora rosea]
VAQSTQCVKVMNKLIKDGVKATSSLCNLHAHFQNLLDNKAKWARHNRYLNSIPTHQQNTNIATTLQQNNTEMFYPDFHIIKHIRSAIYSEKNQQLASKKIKYANGFGKIKKALNITLNLGFTKHHERPSTKRLKSSSKTHNHTGLMHSNYAINFQDPNLRIPLSNISSNNSATIEENKRKYVYNVCGE